MKNDAQLLQDLRSELDWEPSLNAARITVEASRGDVTLGGHVDTYREKVRAADIVRRVSGVKALVVALNVELSGLNRQDDTDIARSVQNALRQTTFLPKDEVRAVVHQGSVTLSGALDWDWQRQGALNAVRHLSGITDITDRILIKFQPSSSILQADIEAALRRRAISNVQNIHIKVRGTSVTISGTVQSWSERELAENCAWSARGVRSVADNMAVVA